VGGGGGEKKKKREKKGSWALSCSGKKRPCFFSPLRRRKASPLLAGVGGGERKKREGEGEGFLCFLLPLCSTIHPHEPEAGGREKKSPLGPPTSCPLTPPGRRGEKRGRKKRTANANPRFDGFLAASRRRKVVTDHPYTEIRHRERGEKKRKKRSLRRPAPMSRSCTAKVCVPLTEGGGKGKRKKGLEGLVVRS